MDKNVLLYELKNALTRGEITQAELQSLAPSQVLSSSTPVAHENRRVKYSEIFYFIGGFIVFLGLAILVFQNWRFLDVSIRLLATLGAAFAFYLSALLFYYYGESTRKVALAFFLMSTLMLPIGLGVYFYQYHFDILSYNFIAPLICFALFFGTFYFVREEFFLALGVIFGTWLFFGGTNYLIAGNPVISKSDFYTYRALFSGLSYVFLGYYVSRLRGSLSGNMYFFGILAILASVMSLMWTGHGANVLLELIYPLILAGTFVLSVFLRSQSFLFWGVIFLMGYILRITSEYFANTIGWPIALVIVGLLFILIAYLAINFNKKYLKRTDSGNLATV